MTRLRKDVKLRLHLCDPFELHLERRAQTSELRFDAGINLLTFGSSYPRIVSEHTAERHLPCLRI